MCVSYKIQKLARKLVEGPHVKSASSKFKDLDLLEGFNSSYRFGDQLKRSHASVGMIIFLLREYFFKRMLDSFFFEIAF